MYGVLLDRVEYMLSRVVQKNGRFAGLCPATAAQNAGFDGRHLEIGHRSFPIRQCAH